MDHLKRNEMMLSKDCSVCKYEAYCGCKLSVSCIVGNIGSRF